MFNDDLEFLVIGTYWKPKFIMVIGYYQYLRYNLINHNVFE